MSDGTGTDVVDVVVVSWNSRETLPACLRSVLAQEGDVEMRVVAVDNASADGTADMLEAEFPGVSLVREPANVGYTAATNHGLARGLAPYVLLLNPDCELMPHTVATLVDFLRGRDDAAAVAPRLFGPSGQAQDFCYRFPSLPLALACYTETGRRVDTRLGGRAEGWRARRDLRTAAAPAPVAHASAACLLLRREAVDGGLEASMPLYFSDVELSHRLAQRGWRVYMDPRASARHRQGDSVNQLPWRLMRHEIRRGVRRFYRLHRGPAARLALDGMLSADALARATFRGARARSPRAFTEELGWLRLLLADQPGPGAPWVE